MQGSFALKLEPHAEPATPGRSVAALDSPSTNIADQSICPRPYQWILHPAIDMMLVCGGMMWILFAAHWFVAAPFKNVLLLQTLGLIAILGTHGLSETHIAATLAKIFKSPQSRKKYHAFTTTLFALFICLGVAGLFIPGVTPWMTRAYLILVAQHFTSQTYGITLLYCYKGGYDLTKIDKLVLRWLLNATAVFAVARQLTYREWSADGFLAQKVPWFGPLPVWVVPVAGMLVISLSAATLFVFVKNAVRDRQLIPLPALLTLFTGVFMFVASRDLVGVLFLYLPAFYHGSQYVALTLAAHLKQQGLPEKIPGNQIYRACSTPAALKYMALLLLLATAIYVGLPRLLEEFGFTYTLSFATVFLVFNLHHFVTDMAIWKMRDPETRRVLVS